MRLQNSEFDQANHDFVDQSGQGVKLSAFSWKVVGENDQWFWRLRYSRSNPINKTYLGIGRRSVVNFFPSRNKRKRFLMIFLLLC